MEYYLGLAKSSLNLNGAKGQKLELDVLRLLYLIRTKNANITGFLMVYDDKIQKRCELWIEKYQCSELLNEKVFIYTFKELLAEKETEKLLIEKSNNIEGNKKSNSSHSKADFGRKKIEDLLHIKMFSFIKDKNPKDNVTLEKLHQDQDVIEFNISWDGFYKKITIANN